MDANLRKKVVVADIDLPQEKGKNLSEREVLPLEKPHNRHSDLFLMIRKKVTSIFDHFGGINSLLEGKKRVFIKPNGIDSKEYCYTRPEVLEAIILECQRADVDEIFVMENSTQCNMTRIVFSAVGYKKI